MRINSLFVFALTAASAWGQLQSGSASSNGVSFSYEGMLEPPTPPLTSHGGGTVTENDVVKRHICDFNKKTCFGYDLRTTALGRGEYRFAFSPLTITAEKMHEIFPKVANWVLLPMPQTPATQVLHAGDTLALDLFVNPATGQKVVDYIKVTGNRDALVVTASGPPRDFSVEEGTLEIARPKLFINGKQQEIQSGGSLSGTPMWMYIHGYGRFVFSLAPRLDLGMRKAGEIRGSTLNWTLGNDNFSVETSKRIAPGEAAYNVYVWNDPGYRPKGDTNATFVMGAGGTLESLVRR